MKGIPVFLACPKFRKGYHFVKKGIQVTGRIKPAPSRRWPSGRKAEVECLDCHYSWWSTHWQAIRQAEEVKEKRLETCRQLGSVDNG